MAREEWHRIAMSLHEMGVLTTVDRAALAAYCQCYGRWVEAEEKLKETPPMLKTPSGFRHIADALNDRGMLTRRGGQWHVSNARNLLLRLKARH